jgi:hypothetical protein
MEKENKKRLKRNIVGGLGVVGALGAAGVVQEVGYNQPFEANLERKQAEFAKRFKIEDHPVSSQVDFESVQANLQKSGQSEQNIVLAPKLAHSRIKQEGDSVVADTESPLTENDLHEVTVEARPSLLVGQLDIKKPTQLQEMKMVGPDGKEFFTSIETENEGVTFTNPLVKTTEFGLEIIGSNNGVPVKVEVAYRELFEIIADGSLTLDGERIDLGDASVSMDPAKGAEKMFENINKSLHAALDSRSVEVTAGMPLEGGSEKQSQTQIAFPKKVVLLVSWPMATE